ncbi:MAG: alpha/beta hydrolase [Candidatus Aminicenantes bacterium]|jgi:proline iminopeptidase
MNQGFVYARFRLKGTAIFLVSFFALFCMQCAGDKMSKGEKPGKVKVSKGYVTTTDGVRLFYQKMGQGSRTVIIPNAVYLFNSFKYLAKDRRVIFYDLRNRGRSDHLTDPEKLNKGILFDVEDLETIRGHFGSKKVDIIGHSYLGLMVILYTLKHPEAVNRVVQIGSSPLKFGTTYPPHLTAMNTPVIYDANKAKEVQELEKKGINATKEHCEKWWAVYGAMFVVNPKNTDKVYDNYCQYKNEWIGNFYKHISTNITPSIKQLKVSWEDIKKIPHPVLTIHGRKDRNAPYGSGREWAFYLPNARLLTIENAAHLPWIEAPEIVFEAIKTFLDGKWPKIAEVVKKIDPDS